jgi:hypothetical protein
VNLPSGKSIAVFFYDGPISRAVAFEQLLRDGQALAGRLLGGFHDQRPWPQLVHIATDGETYGHHHRFGDMALAFALHHIESTGAAQLTNYGEFLERFPPQHEAEVVEDTSWSCVHGVERWRSDCGCNSGGRPGWNQKWRAGLRQSLDWLRDELAPRYQVRAQGLLKEPWRARDQYVQVVLDRSPENLEKFLAEHAAHPLNEEETVVALKLLEMQRHAMLMYTSCGWFFDELSGIETVQVVQYAGRAIQLAQEVFGDHTESEFRRRIAEAKSNLAEQGDGARIYERHVRPAMVDLPKVAAHYAISSLFEELEARVFCYEVERDDYRVLEAGRSQLALGKARVRSVITQEAALLTFGVLYMGEHNLSAAVRQFQSDEAFRATLEKTAAAFERADLAEVIRLMDKEFQGISYSLSSLFRDQQRKIIHRLLESIYEQAEASYRQVYDQHAPIMRFMGELNMRLPRVFEITAEFVLNAALRRAFREADPDLDRISTLLHTAQREQVKLDYEGLAFTLTKTLERLMAGLGENPSEVERLQKLVELLKLARSMPSAVNLWRVQNVYYRLLQTVYPEYRSRTDEEARGWLQHFTELGRELRVRVETAPGKTAPIVVA